MRFQDTLHKPTNTPQHTLWHVAFSTNYVGSSGTPLTMQRLAFLKMSMQQGHKDSSLFRPPRFQRDSQWRRQHVLLDIHGYVDAQGLNR